MGGCEAMQGQKEILVLSPDSALMFLHTRSKLKVSLAHIGADRKYQPFEPLQDGFGDEPRYRGANRRTLSLLVVAVAKLEILIVRQALFYHFNSCHRRYIEIKIIHEVKQSSQTQVPMVRT